MSIIPLREPIERSPEHHFGFGLSPCQMAVRA
jgi:hypothetical protein